MKVRIFLFIFFVFSGLAIAQNTADLPEKFEFTPSSIELTGTPLNRNYFDCAGRKAILMGKETGLVEAWVFPMKIFHNFEMGLFSEKSNTFYNLKDYAVKISRNPHFTEITYSCDKFTIKNRMFTPVNHPGGIILLDISIFEPFKLVVSFSPDLKPMWPAGLGGQYAFWNENVKGIILSESRRIYNGIVGSPLGVRAASTPAHQLPGGKISFEIPVSVKTAEKYYIPIVIAGNTNGREDAVKKYNEMQNNIRKLYESNEKYYHDLLYNTAYIETPDKNLNTAFHWAKIGVDNGMADNPDLGTGLVAGYGLSGERERPGFGWYFGGDAFYNLFAVNSIGNFDFCRTALEFLRKNQRDDGKMMHELSQGAGFINWFEDYPYGYYHADTTPLYLIAIADYLRASGDIDFLKQSWESVKKAYSYIRSTDTDNDGLMENSAAGLGASELGSLREGLKVGIFLSGVCLESYNAFKTLAKIMNDNQLENEAAVLFEKGRATLHSLFYNPESGLIPFGISVKNELKNDVTVWPAVPLVFKLFDRERAVKTLVSFSEYHLSTDWGTRMLSSRSPFYEPLAYNNGAVWPFLTGYVTMAEYNNNFACAGFTHLKQMANNAFGNGLGTFNELFSGEYFKPLSTSVQHQLFSISPIVTNTVRGVFGITADALNNSIQIAPRLPANWGYANIRNIKSGDEIFNVIIKKNENALSIKVNKKSTKAYNAEFAPFFGLLTEIEEVKINGKQVDFNIVKERQGIICSFEGKLVKDNEIEVFYKDGIEILPNYAAPEEGAVTKSLKITDFYLRDGKLCIIVQGVSGKEYEFKIKSGFKIRDAKGAQIIKAEDKIYYFKVIFEKIDLTYSSKTLELIF